MSYGALLGANRPNSEQHLSRGFASQRHAKPHHTRHAHNGHHRARLRLRGHDSFTLQSASARSASLAKTSTLSVEPQILSATVSSGALSTSSRTLVRQDENTGTTTTIQKDRVDFSLHASQVGLTSNDAEGIAAVLEGQADALESVFKAAGLLGDFNSDASTDFLSRVRTGLDNVDIAASSLDLKVSVRTKTIRVENADDGSISERTIQQIDIRARFVSLDINGNVSEAQEPVEANLDVGSGQGLLSGLGPLTQFDFNGDGQFTFEDITALADELIDVSRD